MDVLLITAEAQTSESIIPVVESEGYEFCLARDLEEGLGMAAANAPRLILLEAPPGGKNLSESVRKIKSVLELAAVPVVLIIAEEYSGGADGFLAKPVAKNAVLDQLRARLIDKAEAQRRALYHELPIPVCMVDKNRKILYANKRLGELVGIPEDQLIGGYACGAFGCVNAGEDLQGCGRSAPCAACTYKQAIEETLDTGKTNQNIEKIFSLAHHGVYRNLHLSGTTTRIHLDGGNEVLLCLENISGRQKNYNELAVLKVAIEQSPITTMVTDIRGNIQYVNPVFVQKTGYTAEEAIGLNPRILKAGDMSNEAYRQMWLTISSGENWKGVFHNKKKNGELYWEEAVISPVKDENGEITHYLALKQDITERLRLEEDLKFRLSFQEIVANISSHFIRVDDKSFDEAVNMALRQIGELFGVDRAHLIRFSEDSATLKNTHEWCGPGIEPQKDNLQDLPLNGLPWWLKSISTEKPLYIPDTGALPPEARLEKEVFIAHGVKSLLCLPLKNVKKELLGIIGLDAVRALHSWEDANIRMLQVIADIISEAMVRRESEIYLSEVEERLNLAIESVGDGIWDWEIKTGDMLYSELYMQMLGYGHYELPHRLETWRASVHPEDLPRVMKTLDTYLQGDLPLYMVELRVRCKDGSYKWILCRGSIVARDADGYPARMVGIHTDISRQKANEAELLKSIDALDRANHIKNEFVSSMSHELRTPLNAILGFGQLLQLEEGLTDMQSDYIREIVIAGEHLLHLINEVLDLSKIESGQIDLNIESVFCLDVVKESVQLVQSLADTHNVRIHYDHRMDSSVSADRTRLKQVLVNLLSNAVKYNRPGGSVRVEASVQDKMVRLRVIDSGFGIPEARQKDLFVLFNRLGRESSDIQGSGIGLAFSKRLVDLMGGRIGVESIVDKGSEFWVELPEKVQEFEKP